MGTIISIIVGVIAIFAFLSYIATPKGEDAEENAKVGAAAGAYFLLSIAPTVTIIIIIVLLVKSCT